MKKKKRRRRNSIRQNPTSFNLTTVDGKDFKGNEGKNTQLELGKDLFLKGLAE